MEAFGLEISVIVPVYNVDQFLENCLSSILKQTFEDFEVLLIDDGSSDKSGAICDKYAQKDKRIKVMHIENNGVSNARNLGIQEAKGKYIAFIDSDDYVEATYLETLLSTLKRNDVDCALCSFYSESIENSILAIMNEPIKPNEILTLFGSKDLLLVNPAVWNKLYIREIIIQNNITFDTKLRIGEDLLFYLTYLLFCTKIVYVDTPLYHYIQRPNSAINSQNCKKNRDILLCVEKILCMYRSANNVSCFYSELEYLAIFHIYLSAIPRILIYDVNNSLIEELEVFLKRNFPSYKQNPYLKKQRKSRIILFDLIDKKRYHLVRAILKLKNKKR